VASEPSAANVYETDAEQYSSKTNSWVRVSNDSYVYTGVTGNGVCLSGSQAPYFNFSFFGDGPSDWQAIPAGNTDAPSGTYSPAPTPTQSVSINPGGGCSASRRSPASETDGIFNFLNFIFLIGGAFGIKVGFDRFGKKK
jgi:hypothetical protein